jgi:hypothetical protein
MSAVAGLDDDLIQRAGLAGGAVAHGVVARRPGAVMLVEELPGNSTDKIQKNAVRQRFSQCCDGLSP